MTQANLDIKFGSGAPIPAIIKTRRGAKRMTMRIDPIARRIVVNGPLRLSQRDALKFIQENQSWIETRLAKLPVAAQFSENSEILFRGRPTKLKRRDGRGSTIYTDDGAPELELACTAQRFEPKVRQALKAYAHSDALAYCEKLSAQLGKRPKSISLRDTRSRWGSCTSQGDIMLSWRLICAPPRVFEYVVAHELAHLLELNHSPRFWAHVSGLMPDWKQARDWLKANGALLHAIGR